jgi:hypothetical protein
MPADNEHDYPILNDDQYFVALTMKIVVKLPKSYTDEQTSDILEQLEDDLEDWLSGVCSQMGDGYPDALFEVTQ